MTSRPNGPTDSTPHDECSRVSDGAMHVHESDPAVSMPSFGQTVSESQVVPLTPVAFKRYFSIFSVGVFGSAETNS